jgi:secondary thiamine-phosphate synthase enzyme
MRKNISVSTSRREELVDITVQVQEAVIQSGVENGLAVLYVQGATAALMIQENWDESVQTDVVNLLRADPQGNLAA